MGRTAGIIRQKRRTRRGGRVESRPGVRFKGSGNVDARIVDEGDQTNGVDFPSAEKATSNLLFRVCETALRRP
jgi:hypothetical protein